MVESRTNHTATVLDDGWVLVAGGFSEDFFDNIDTAELFTY